MKKSKRWADEVLLSEFLKEQEGALNTALRNGLTIWRRCGRKDCFDILAAYQNLGPLTVWVDCSRPPAGVLRPSTEMYRLDWETAAVSIYRGLTPAQIHSKRYHSDDELDPCSDDCPVYGSSQLLDVIGLLNRLVDKLVKEEFEEAESA